MHPREFKRQRTGTGRVTRKSLINSEILVGVDFTLNERFVEILTDAMYYPVLLFPGEGAVNVSKERLPDEVNERKLLVIIIDATWPSARKILRSSANLQTLPRITFDFAGVSKFNFKTQPHEFALSTIEATYRLLQCFETQGIENLYGQHDALMLVLDSIVEFQLACEANPSLPSYRLNNRFYPRS